MSGIFAQADADFQSEIKEKDEQLNKTNAALKESGSSLIEEKKRMDDLSKNVRSKDELMQRIRNLKRFNKDMRDQLSTNSHVQEGVQIGEADKGLDLDGKLNKIDTLFPDGIHEPGNSLTQQQISLLTNLERAEVLTGRVQAYQTHNAVLDNEARNLKGRSKELEEKYRKIISLCTSTPEGKVDDLLDQLVQAVVSEQKDMASSTDLSRVREFLRSVAAE